MALTAEELEAIMERKNKMRREAYDRRNAQENKDEVSAKAVANFLWLFLSIKLPTALCGTSIAVQNAALRQNY